MIRRLVARTVIIGTRTNCVGAMKHNSNERFQVDICFGICDGLGGNPHLSNFGTVVQSEKMITKSFSTQEILLNKLESALKNHQIAEAWEVFNDVKRLHGFPNNSLVNRLIVQLCYSSDPQWLRKAYDLVLLILKDKSYLLGYDYLTRLALSLARAQMPVPASTVLRIMLEIHKYPPLDIWKTVFLHMVKSDIGTFLASDILVEICNCFLSHMKDQGVDNVKNLKLMRPDTMIFNLVLNACVRFGSTLKAERIVELMALTGVVADATTIVIIALIHEMNGQRDELKKFKEHVSRVSVPLFRHYRQFYDSLLNLHFKFDDIDAAADLVLDMYREKGYLLCSGGLIPKERKYSQRSLYVMIGPPNLRTSLKLQIEPEVLHKDCVLELERHSELVSFVKGKLVPCNKALAKLISAYKRHGKVGELSKLLIHIQKELNGSEESCLSRDVIDACVQLGWLDTAHDFLEDMESAGKPMGVITYASLLRAYCKQNLFEDAKVLVKQMRKASMLKNMSNEEVISACLSGEGIFSFADSKSANSNAKSCLAEALIEEMRGEEKTKLPLMYEIDSSIYFFCKGNMMEDALKSYRRMLERMIHPTVQTFFNLVRGYFSLRMYREVTILWGAIRRRMESGDLMANRDLLELLLSNFIRGGYFERVLEIIEYMDRYGMYADKWKCKREFLIFHKDLYRNLKASNAKTEAQSKRLEHVRVFRRWVGIN